MPCKFLKTVRGYHLLRFPHKSAQKCRQHNLSFCRKLLPRHSGSCRIQVREAENKDYKTSAVIHVEIDKKNQEWQKKVVDHLIEAIKEAVIDEDQSDQRVWMAMSTNYEDFQESNRKGCAEGLINVKVPDYEDVLDEMRTILNPKKPNYQIGRAHV